MKNNLFIFRSVILWGTFLIIFGWIANSFAQAQCPVDNRMVNMSASDGKYYLPENYIFKIKLDGALSTDTYKTGSIVQFTVIENVFGVKLPEFKTEAELEAFRNDIDTIVDAYKSDIHTILASYRTKMGEILASKLKKKEKAENLEDLYTTTSEELEKLYAKRTKFIEDLFKTANSAFILEIETNYDKNVLEAEKTFQTDTKAVKNKFQSEIDAISPNDPDRKDKIAKIDDRRYAKLEKLEEARAEKLEKLKTGKAEGIKKLKSMPEVVTVIPKDSKGFGKVERAKRQAPLFLNYKARISVVLDYVLLTNGDCIPIEIKETPDERLYNGEKTELGGVIDCKSDGLTGKKCIKGRRPRYNLIPPILSGMAAVATTLLKDSTAQAIAGVTAVDQLSKGDLGNVINGADATISDKLIYEVLTTESRIGTFKKEEKK